MKLTEMEQALNNFDRRLSATAQILPTLATKVELESVRDDIRIVAENVVRLIQKMDDLTDRLERKSVI